MPGEPVVFTYYSGRGVQCQPFETFKDGHVARSTRSCRRSRRRARSRIACSSSPVPRGTALVWEYYFPFGGPSTPWTSSISQALGTEFFHRLDRATAPPTAAGGPNPYGQTAAAMARSFERSAAAGGVIGARVGRALVPDLSLRAAPADPQRPPAGARQPAPLRERHGLSGRAAGRRRRHALRAGAAAEVRHGGLVALPDRAGGGPQLPPVHDRSAREAVRPRDRPRLHRVPRALLDLPRHAPHDRGGRGAVAGDHPREGRLPRLDRGALPRRQAVARHARDPRRERHRAAPPVDQRWCRRALDRVGRPRLARQAGARRLLHGVDHRRRRRRQLPVGRADVHPRRAARPRGAGRDHARGDRHAHRVGRHPARVRRRQRVDRRARGDRWQADRHPSRSPIRQHHAPHREAPGGGPEGAARSRRLAAATHTLLPLSADVAAAPA